MAATLIAKDPAHDLAVLHIPVSGEAPHPLSLGRSATAQVGDGVLAIGNPFGYDRTLTSGIVSALGRSIEAPDGQTITARSRPMRQSTPAAPAARY